MDCDVQQRRPFSYPVTRLATAMMLLALLATAGCMMERVGSAPTDDRSASWATIDPAQSECEQFGCQP